MTATGIGTWTLSAVCWEDWQCAWHKPGWSVSTVAMSPAQGIPAAAMAATSLTLLVTGHA